MGGGGQGTETAGRQKDRACGRQRVRERRQEARTDGEIKKRKTEGRQEHREKEQRETRRETESEKLKQMGMKHKKRVRLFGGMEKFP